MSTDKFDNSKPTIVCPGPTSEAGKAISSKNATKHGCCATSILILPTEDERDFKSLEATWFQAYNPQSEPERHFVQDIVVADWMLQRATRAHAQVEAELYATTPNPAQWTEQQERKLGRHIRYRTAQTNIVAKCRKAMEDYRRGRASERAKVQKADLVQERIKTAQKMNGPIVDWQQHLKDMRAQAIALGFTPPDLLNIESV